MRLPLDPEKNTGKADEFLRRAINNDTPWRSDHNLAA